MFRIHLITILAILILSHISFSQQLDNHTLIVGEVSGRFDYNDIEQLIKKNYYPLSRKSQKTPFRIVKKSFNEVVLEYINPLPSQPKRIIFRLFNSEIALVASIILDEIDFAITESAKTAEEIHKSNQAIRVVFQHKTDNIVKMIAYNNRNPFFNNRTVRRALTHAINKQYILRKLLNNQANITSGPVDIGSKLYDSKFKEYKYNPKRAINLLAEAGWQDLNQDGILKKNNKPFHFTLIYEKGVSLDENVARMIKLDWNKIGIDVSIKPLTKIEIKTKLKSHDFDAILTNYQFKETIENFEYIFGYGSKGNFLNYYNKTVNHFLQLAKKAKTPTKWILLQGIVNTIINEQPASFLFFLWLDWYFVNTTKFENFLDENGELRPFDEWKFRQN